MQQLPSLLSRRLFTAQHVSGVLPPNIRSLMTAVAASLFYLRIVVTDVADHEHNTTVTTVEK
jgi:hypothetical protein